MNRWPMVALGDLLDFRAGYVFPKALQGRIAGEFPFAKVGDISRHSRNGESILNFAGNYLDAKDLKTLKAKPVPAGSVLFAKIGEAIRHNHRVLAGTPMLADNNVMAAVPSDSIDPRYLYRFLQTIDLYGMTSSTTVPALRKTELQLIRIPLPPLPEQCRIVAILDQAHTIRTKRHETVERLDDAIQATFISVFGMLDENPHQFPIITLGELCSDNFRNGLSPSKSGTIESKVLTLSAITRGRFDSTCVKNARFNCWPPMDQQVDSKDFLICRGNGNISLVGQGQFPDTSIPTTAYPDTIIAARVETNKASKEYVQQAWKSRFIRNQIESAARTTNGTYKINQTTLSQIRLPLPDHRRQYLFNTIVDKLTATRIRYLDALTQLDALFASLQARAFAGEL